ncbi:MAG TPA: TonB-dependent receptor [Gemmatimonadaceae bacterium]|nr:TonB-dependent receptor [Gemmatimonadaceae bacterium]
MSIRSLALAAILAAAPALSSAQVPDSTKASAHADSLRARLAARRESLEVDSLLHHHQSRLSAVTITATPVDRSEPLSVVKIDQKQISLTPSNSPYELFRNVAGLEAHEQGQGPGFASDVSIRGFSSDHSTDIALYVDGVPNNDPINGHAEGYNDFNLLFPAIITNIDVVRGPTSALYGNFAFGGAINVRTLDKFDGVQVTAGGGSFGNGQGSLLAGFDHGTTGGILAIDGFREDGFRAHSQNQYGHLHAALTHDFSPKTTIDGAFDYYLTSYQSPGFISDSQYQAHQYNFVSNFGDGGFKRRTQERVSLRTFVTPDLQWRTTVFAKQSTWNFWLSTPPGLGGLTEGSGAETHEYDGRFEFGGTTALTYARPGVDITLGADTRYAQAHYQNWAEQPGAFRQDATPLAIAQPARQTSEGLYLQTGFDVTKYARLDLGGRVDQVTTSVRQPQQDSLGNLLLGQPFHDSQYSKGIFSPKTGLLIRPFVDLGQPGIGLFVDVSRGFRQTDGVITDVQLPFITVWDYETGIKLDEGPLTLDAALFRMDVSNEQSFDPALNQSIGGGQSRRNGLDVTANVRIVPGVTATTDFTILHAFYTHFVDPNDGIDYSGRPVFNTSKYMGAAFVNVALPSQIWEAHLGANFQGPYTPFEEIGVLRPGFVLFNVAAGVHMNPRTLFMVGVRNLFDTNYRELESGGQVTPGQGRAVYATVQYKVL